MAAAPNTRYAEDLYRDFAAKNRGIVAFEVSTVSSGKVDSLGPVAMVDLTGAPSYTLFVDDTDLLQPKASIAEPNLEDIYLDDLAFTVDGFAKVGYPLEQGDYRLLQVVATVGKQTHIHTAVEFCWPAQEHCVVFDPNIDFLDSEVRSWRDASAQGKTLEIFEEDAFDVGFDPIGGFAAGRCGLASDPRRSARWYQRAARTVHYRSLAGIVVVRKAIGATQAGFRCSRQCRPSPFGYAHVSEASAVFPNSVACDSQANRGIRGFSGKFVARSGCSHRFVLGAKYNLEAKGVGIGVDVTLSATGSIDQNGVEYVDTCARF
jgi:hypothetical protein